MSSRPKYYWDSCIFIAWIRNEKRGAGEIEGIEEIAKDVTNGKADLFTSIVTRTEVLEGEMSDTQKDTFRKLFQRKNVLVIDLNDRISDKSKEIREWNPKISTPDSIHLATAIVYEATEFHTTDGSGKKKAGHLIPLSGNVNGYNLKICTPLAKQYSLLAGLGGTRTAAAKGKK